MVQGGEGVRPVVGPCKSEVRAPRDSETDGTSLAFAMALHHFLCGCTSFCGFLVGVARWRGGQGADGQVPPSHEVERDHHHAGLCG